MQGEIEVNLLNTSYLELIKCNFEAIVLIKNPVAYLVVKAGELKKESAPVLWGINT